MMAHCFTQCSNGCSLGSLLFRRQHNPAQRCSKADCVGICGDLLWRFEVAVDDFIPVQMLHPRGDLMRPDRHQGRGDLFVLLNEIVQRPVLAVFHHEAVTRWLGADAPEKQNVHIRKRNRGNAMDREPRRTAHFSSAADFFFFFSHSLLERHEIDVIELPKWLDVLHFRQRLDFLHGHRAAVVLPEEDGALRAAPQPLEILNPLERYLPRIWNKKGIFQ